MPQTAPPVAVALASAKPSDIKTDLLFVPVFEGEPPAAAVPGLDEASGRMVGQAGERGEFRGKPFELFLTSLEGWSAPRVVLIGAGKAADFDTERLRKLATAAGLAARPRRVPPPASRSGGGRAGVACAARPMASSAGANKPGRW